MNDKGKKIKEYFKKYPWVIHRKKIKDLKGAKKYKIQGAETPCK